jgi:hypothetical protein
MKSVIKYATFFVTAFVVFTVSSLVANWVLLLSGCIWTSSASFGISFIAGLGIGMPIVQFIWDVTHLF